MHGHLYKKKKNSATFLAAACMSVIPIVLNNLQVFREVAYKARNRQDILAGVDEFLDQVTALPPGEWDPKIRIEPPDKVPDQVCCGRSLNYNICCRQLQGYINSTSTG